MPTLESWCPLLIVLATVSQQCHPQGADQRGGADQHHAPAHDSVQRVGVVLLALVRAANWRSLS